MSQREITLYNFRKQDKWQFASFFYSHIFLPLLQIYLISSRLNPSNSFDFSEEGKVWELLYCSQQLNWQMLVSRGSMSQLDVENLGDKINLLGSSKLSFSNPVDFFYLENAGCGWQRWLRCGNGLTVLAMCSSFLGVIYWWFQDLSEQAHLR